jgi:hypothetical protein
MDSIVVSPGANGRLAPEDLAGCDRLFAEVDALFERGSERDRPIVR